MEKLKEFYTNNKMIVNVVAIGLSVYLLWKAFKK